MRSPRNISGMMNPIRKPECDYRNYRFIQLENRMKCLLVEDSKTQTSAATVYVKSGSLNDPNEAMGLAHFCEHMLFLGTEKYPDESHYAKFLMKNGGSKNAATGEDYTYYFFDVKNEKFGEALDIFSQFFKKPQFTESATDREMNAVDNEFKKNLSNEARRVLQIEKSILAANGSKRKRFATGNLESLKVPGIRDHLLKYYSERYSSNLMSLCLVGNQPLNELEKFARENFTDIVDKDLSLVDFSDDPMFDGTSLGHVIQFIPIKEMRLLTIKWPKLPSVK